MSDTAIRVNNVSKLYRLGETAERYNTLRDTIAKSVSAPFRRMFGSQKQERRKRAHEEDNLLWALKDVSFEVKRGEVLGIIGRNGAGKSTLLKVLSRITEPTDGSIDIYGRVASLLEVGTGFHPELTGRENIFLNGSILGMSHQEIKKKFDEIVDFAGVERFIDTPVKRYSSGMGVRLGFSVAAHLEPEILIIDEVLAVGDVEFQKKCLGKMEDVGQSGRTVLFVSHNMAAVESLCDRGIELKQGTKVFDGDVASTISNYHCSLLPTQDKSSDSSDKSQLLQSIELIDLQGVKSPYLRLGEDLIIRMTFKTSERIQNPQIGLGFDNYIGQRILTIHTPANDKKIDCLEGTSSVLCKVPRCPLAPGTYTLKIALTALQNNVESLEAALIFDVVDADAFDEGRGFHKGMCCAPSHWSLES